MIQTRLDSLNPSESSFYSNFTFHLLTYLTFSIYPTSPAGHLKVRCENAGDLLSPYDPDVMTLEESRYVYSAKFTFTGASGSLAILEIAFTRSPLSTKFEQEMKCWYKCSEGCGVESALDITVIDFEKLAS